MRWALLINAVCTFQTDIDNTLFCPVHQLQRLSPFVFHPSRQNLLSVPDQPDGRTGAVDDGLVLGSEADKADIQYRFNPLRWAAHDEDEHYEIVITL